MKVSKFLFVALLASLALSLSLGSASGQVITGSQLTTTAGFDGQITPAPSNDIILQGSSSLVGSPAFEKADGGAPFSYSGINDGASNFHGGGDYGDGVLFNAGQGTNDQTITFTLNTTASPLGYDINQINTFAGYPGIPSLADQKYTVSIQLVGSSIWTQIADVTYNPTATGNVSSEVTITPLLGPVLATGIQAIQFYNEDTGQAPDGAFPGGTVMNEFQVLGSPTLSVPEPSTYAMMISGLALLAFCVRRKLA
jgi:hypothetical protein